MSQDMQAKGQSPEERAEDLLGQLDRHYVDYLERYQQQQNSKGNMSRLFVNWFTSFEPAASDSMHQDFLTGIEQLIAELTLVLAQLEQESPQRCRTFAGQAVCRLLKSRPAKEKTTADWYMTVAEYQCSPLLPYLSKEDLKHYHDLMLERVPRRLMFPKQKQLLEQMEAIMDAKK